MPVSIIIRNVGHVWRVLVSFAGLSLSFGNAGHAADLPFTRLDSITPPGARPGSETEVVVAGADLDGVDGAWFSHPGLSAKFSKDKTFVVKVDESVPAGLYDMRVVGLHGVSGPRALYVDRQQSVLKTGECTLAKPMDLAVGSAVYGAVTAANRDHFRFRAKMDQVLTIRCIARELDSKLTPVFAVFDEGGSKLLGNERRGAIEFRAPKDGAYIIGIQDIAYAGGADFQYRISVDESSLVEVVVPNAVEAGKRSKVTVLGRRLPASKISSLKGSEGKPLEMLEVEMDVPAQGAPVTGDGAALLASAGIRTTTLRHAGANGVANALELAVVSAPVVSSTDLTADEGGSKKVVEASLPVAVSGLFRKGFEGVPVEFDAKKGDVLLAEVISNRLGAVGTNPYLRLAKSGVHLAEAYGPETNLGGVRLSTLHNDPSLRFEVKEDGRYTLFLNDLSGATRRGIGAPYTLLIQSEKADFGLIAASEAPAETTNDRAASPRGVVLRAGGTAALRIIALRSGGFTQEVELVASGLPPGVTCEPSRIPAGKNEGVLVLRADASVAKAVHLIEVTGRSGDGKLERKARGAFVRWSVPDAANAFVDWRLTRGAGIPVGTTTNPSPVTLTPQVAGPLEVDAGGKVEVGLKIHRAAEFKEAFKIKTAGFAGAETVKEVDADPKAELVKVPLDLSALKLVQGKYSPYFTVQTKAKFAGRDVITTVFSTPVQILVRAPAPKTESKQPEPAAPTGTPAPAK